MLIKKKIKILSLTINFFLIKSSVKHDNQKKKKVKDKSKFKD